MVLKKDFNKVIIKEKLSKFFYKQDAEIYN